MDHASPLRKSVFAVFKRAPGDVLAVSALRTFFRDEEISKPRSRSSACFLSSH
jgi:hypothetical protein